MDEATASIDSDNESYIQEAIDALVNGKILLVIAHRLNTIKNANQILVLDEGKCVGMGTHKELLKNCDVYKQIALSQLSKEDYLEAILIIQQNHGYVRCTDVADHLRVKKPSVSRAVKELSKKKCVMKKTDGTLSLTEQGQKLAKQIYERHLFFTQQLMDVGVPYEIAEQDACRLEHVISEESFKRLREANKRNVR